jgi:hypothetical protein
MRAVRGGPGGAPFSTDCGSEYVVGLYARAGFWIDAIGLKCGSFGPDNKMEEAGRKQGVLRRQRRRTHPG